MCNNQKQIYAPFKSCNLNPFVPNAPFPYPLKTSEILQVYRYFQGVEKGCIGNGWVKSTWLFQATFLVVFQFIRKHFQLTFFIFYLAAPCPTLRHFLNHLKNKLQLLRLSQGLKPKYNKPKRETSINLLSNVIAILKTCTTIKTMLT